MGKGGKGKGKGKSRPPEPEGPPDYVEPMGELHHTAENLLVCKSTNEKIPHFNARIFLEDKKEVGRVEEVFGPINSVYFSVQLPEGVQAESFKPGKKFFIDSMKLLPMSRFLPQPPISKAGKGGKKGGKGKGGKDKGKGKKGGGKDKGKGFGKDKGKGKGGGGGTFTGRGGGRGSG
mmetsp:Transcript_46788/g.85646  ORF Transcript_46788/g.85646 Transcript_46788/m.85646 type:complete len:176 (-) Transcript_46788:39-566(-)